MERFSNRNVDEMGRLSLPLTLRKRAKWTQATTLTFTQLGNVGILQSEHEITGTHQVLVVLDELGRFTVPTDLRKKLGLEVRSEFYIYYIDSGIVVIESGKD